MMYLFKPHPITNECSSVCRVEHVLSGATFDMVIFTLKNPGKPRNTPQFYYASFPANGALSSPGKGTVSTTSLTTSMLSKGTLLISSSAFSGHPKNRELAMIGADAIFITLSNREVCP